MEIRYFCECYNRTLVVEFPGRYHFLMQTIFDDLDQYYDEWMACETEVVHDVCLEEYMMQRLSETYGMWITWNVEED
jgi:hypothetical protein